MLELISFFNGLNEKTLRAIESQSIYHKYDKGAMLINKGDVSECIFILCVGKVHVFIDDDTGKRVILKTLNSPDIFGELALFSGDNRSANITAAKDCEVLVIQKELVLKAFHESSDFCFNVIRYLAKKINSLTEDISCLALLDNYGRIRRLLLEQAACSSNGSMTGKLTQQEIADRIGSSREMVSRILKDLKIGGYIEIEDKQIKILKQLPKAW